MLKIREYFLSPVAQKRANELVNEFKKKVEAIVLVPVNFAYQPVHQIIPAYQIQVFNTNTENNDEVFNAMMSRKPDDVTIFVDSYGRDALNEVISFSFNGDFAKINNHVFDNRLLLSYAKGVEPDKLINLIPFEDKSKGWKHRIANGDTMWPVRGLPLRFQARAESLFKDGSTEPLAYWRDELVGFKELEAEKALRDAKKALEDAEKKVEEAERQRRTAEEEFEKAKKYWGYDDPEAVHFAESFFHEYIDEELLYDYGSDIVKEVIIEHFDDEDHIAIEVYGYGIKTKDRYIFAKDGESLIEIKENV